MMNVGDNWTVGIFKDPFKNFVILLPLTLVHTRNPLGWWELPPRR